MEDCVRKPVVPGSLHTAECDYFNIQNLFVFPNKAVHSAQFVTGKYKHINRAPLLGIKYLKTGKQHL
jgi:hypothetical protein